MNAIAEERTGLAEHRTHSVCAVCGARGPRWIDCDEWDTVPGPDGETRPRCPGCRLDALMLARRLDTFQVEHVGRTADGEPKPPKNLVEFGRDMNAYRNYTNAILSLWRAHYEDDVLREARKAVARVERETSTKTPTMVRAPSTVEWHGPGDRAPLRLNPDDSGESHGHRRSAIAGRQAVGYADREVADPQTVLVGSSLI